MPLSKMIKMTSNGSTGSSRTTDKTLTIYLDFIMNLLRFCFRLTLWRMWDKCTLDFTTSLWLAIIPSPPLHPHIKMGNEISESFTDLRLPGQQRWRPKTRWRNYQQKPSRCWLTNLTKWRSNHTVLTVNSEWGLLFWPSTTAWLQVRGTG